MLAQFYKFVAVNNTGQTLTYNSNARLNLKVTPWYITPSTGLIAYAPDSDDDFGFGAGETVADGAEVLSSEVNNTSD